MKQFLAHNAFARTNRLAIAMILVCVSVCLSVYLSVCLGQAYIVIIWCMLA